MSRDDRVSFFGARSANEGLGIFITAEVFFPAFFFKKKADPIYDRSSLTALWKPITLRGLPRLHEMPFLVVDQHSKAFTQTEFKERIHR